MVEDIENGIESIRESMKQFNSKNAEVGQELYCLKLAESKGSHLWDVLSLPTVNYIYTEFIRSGERLTFKNDSKNYDSS